jgi:hypothetical protein
MILVAPQTYYYIAKNTTAVKAIVSRTANSRVKNIPVRGFWRLSNRLCNVASGDSALFVAYSAHKKEEWPSSLSARAATVIEIKPER